VFRLGETLATTLVGLATRIARTRCVAQPQRGPHPRHLRQMGSLRERTGLLPLCKLPPARCFSYLALSFAIQPLCARPPRSHRGSSLALREGVEDSERCPYEALDSSVIPTKNVKRRGEGWLAGLAYTSDGLTTWDGVRGLPFARGHRSYGRHHRFWLLCRFGPRPTGGLKTFFAVRHRPNSRLPSVGSAAVGPYYVAYSRALRAKKTIGAGWNATGHAYHPPAQAQSSRKRSSGPSA
jgi:hypothetical protein